MIKYKGMQYSDWKKLCMELLKEKEKTTECKTQRVRCDEWGSDICEDDDYNPCDDCNRT